MSREINHLLEQEELMWRQRSRAVWLKAGDRKTEDFHKEASQRQKRNSIHGIRDASGEWQTDPGKVNFSGLLQKSFHHKQPTTCKCFHREYREASYGRDELKLLPCTERQNIALKQGTKELLL